tara:strand:- start:32 stop:409 length:378 start_codon:yes stop_codon:yes gene_type:complete
MIYDGKKPKPLTLIFWIVFLGWVVSAVIYFFLPDKSKKKIGKRIRIIGWLLFIVYLLVIIIFFMAEKAVSDEEAKKNPLNLPKIFQIFTWPMGVGATGTESEAGDLGTKATVAGRGGGGLEGGRP